MLMFFSIQSLLFLTHLFNLAIHFSVMKYRPPFDDNLKIASVSPLGKDLIVAKF